MTYTQHRLPTIEPGGANGLPFTLSAEDYSSIRRLAKALTKTSDFSAIIPDLVYAHQTDAARTEMEITSLVRQLESLSPGHGEKLARDLRQEGLPFYLEAREPVELAGGPDSRDGRVHVKAYDQDRDGTETDVSSHTRSLPGSGSGSDTGPGRFFSPNGDDFFKSDGKVAKGRATPKLEIPIAEGKLRGGGLGHFDARRHGEKGYYQHGGVDISAAPGTPTSAAAAGKVTTIGTSTKTDTDGNEKIYHYVETTTKDGYKVRQHYVDPAVKVGDNVKPGQTIGAIDNLEPRYGKDMPNHTHVEVYDTKTIGDNGRADIKRFKRIDPALFMGM